MEQNTFIDRFFHSCHELSDFRQAGERDINTLYTFLNLLHSLNDRLKEGFDINELSRKPEFRLLRLIRNYFHHVGDVDEFRIFQTREGVYTSHMEMIIIPVALVARSVENFRTQPSNIKNPKRAIRELDSIAEAFTDFHYICENATFLSTNTPFHNGGHIYYFGFDLFKAVYNVCNVVADICRNTEALADKQCIQELGEEFTENNNIERDDLFLMPGAQQPLLTTQGYIIPV